jgi:Bax protein
MKFELDNSRKIELSVAAATSVAMVILIAVVAQLSSPAHQQSLQPDLVEPIVVFPDFAAIPSVDVKKQQFFDYLQDYIAAENNAIVEIRQELTAYADIANSGVAFSARKREWVLELAETYRIDNSGLDDRDIVNELMLRVDVLPISLALAQAANESAWGTSRFVLEANNIFGQWCYAEGCGVVPSRRRDGATHEVKRFESIESAVEAYLININSHPSYQYLREMRAEMRRRKQALDPMVLAYGLGRYSERGDHYVDEVQNIILQNDLKRRDQG